MTIRVTAIPTIQSPNSGYHPVFFGVRHDNVIWPIPSSDKFDLDYDKTVYSFLDRGFFKNLLNTRLLRIFALIIFFFRALGCRKEAFFVHSFIFCLPLFLANCNYTLVIHGTDKRHLKTRFGRLLANGAKCVYGIGFGGEFGNIQVQEVPNVYDLDHLSRSEMSVCQRYDVLFILRNSPVKNPKYPFYLFTHFVEGYAASIGVIGLSEDTLSISEQNKLNKSRNELRSIDYLGRLPFNRVASLLKNSSILIIPSHSEGIAKAMMEALFCGLHIIVSKSLVIPEAFEPFVIRADFNDHASVWKLVNELKRQGKNENNTEFAIQYLNEAIEYLDDIYLTQVP